MMKILIVKTSSLGDLIHVFPVVEFLKLKYPTAQIDWVVEKPYAQMIKAHPLVGRVLSVDTKSWRKSLWKRAVWKEIISFKKELREVAYDVVFDLQGNTKSGIITGLARAQRKVGFASDVVPEWPNLLFTDQKYTLVVGRNIRADYLSLVQQFCGSAEPFVEDGVRLAVTPQEADAIRLILSAPQLQGRFRVLVCSGSLWKNKQVSQEALLGFLRLLDKDRHAGLLFVWGSSEEKTAAEEMQKHFPDNSVIVDRLPLPALQNLMAEVDLVVAMDSLPLHLAGTTGVCTFSAFGASSAAKYKPEGSQHLAVQGACPYGRTFEKRCPVLRTCPTGQCIKGLTAEELFAGYKSHP